MQCVHVKLSVMFVVISCAIIMIEMFSKKVIKRMHGMHVNLSNCLFFLNLNTPTIILLTKI